MQILPARNNNEKEPTNQRPAMKKASGLALFFTTAE
jgi:hypothetical protein